MTYPDNQNYGLAAGFNVFPLQTIAGYKPSGVARPFDFFVGFGTYSVGAIRVLPTLDYFSGYPITQWIFSYIDYDQWLWLSTTYCNGGYSGYVTALVTEKDQLTPKYWNAKMSIPKESDLRAYRPGWDHPAITFSKRSVATPP